AVEGRGSKAVRAACQEGSGDRAGRTRRQVAAAAESRRCLLPTVEILYRLPLPRPLDGPPQDDTLVTNQQRRGVAVVAAQLRRGRSPLPLAGLGEVEQVDGVRLAEAEVLQPQQVLRQGPAVHVAEADVPFPAFGPPGPQLVERHHSVAGLPNLDGADAPAIP